MPIADEQDHVLRLARPGGVDRPCHLAAARAVTDLDDDRPRLFQRDIAKHQRRLLLAVLALDKRCGPAEHGSIVLAIDRYLQFRLVDPVRKFNFEVELRAGDDFSTVDRIDCLGNNR
jgi:hypothetical protein